MELDHRPAHGPVLERGSAVVEGVVALGMAFLLLTLLTQAGFALVARNAAEGAVGAAARRAARPGADVGRVAAQLDDTLARTLPGVRRAASEVTVSGGTARAEAEVHWEPPGPGWLRMRFQVQAAVPVLAPP